VLSDMGMQALSELTFWVEEKTEVIESVSTCCVEVTPREIYGVVLSR
jgi:hypothetical protein